MKIVMDRNPLGRATAVEIEGGMYRKNALFLQIDAGGKVDISIDGTVIEEADVSKVEPSEKRIMCKAVLRALRHGKLEIRPRFTIGVRPCSEFDGHSVIFRLPDYKGKTVRLRLRPNGTEALLKFIEYANPTNEDDEEDTIQAIRIIPAEGDFLIKA